MALESVTGLAAASSIQARYEALFRVSRTIGAHRDPEELFRQLAVELRGVVDFDALYCTRYDPLGEQPCISVMETPARRIPMAVYEPEETMTAWVYEHREPLVIPFLERETRFPNVT